MGSGTVVSYYNKKLKHALECFNRMDFHYTVSLKEMMYSYFKFCDQQMVLFNDDIQVVVYSYNKRSSTFVGLVNKKTSYSPDSMAFVKKYLTFGSSALVFSKSVELGSVKKSSELMELPI
jgi:hypothetical protein